MSHITPWRAATELRAIAAGLGERSAGIRYGWWTGGADDPDYVAAARRAADDLEAAAVALGPEWPRRPLYPVVSLATMYAAFLGILVAAPDAGHPLAILAAVVAVLLVEDLFVWRSVRRAADRPAVPAPDVAELRARLTDVLDRFDRDFDSKGVAAASIERALMWIEDE
jgi:hypothetical protein